MRKLPIALLLNALVSKKFLLLQYEEAPYTLTAPRPSMRKLPLTLLLPVFSKHRNI
jgi:hypothetical protein